MNIELHHLKYFVAVAENLSFTRAAGLLRVAQPSLTRQIRNLESEVGVVLLERSRSRVALTAEGKALLATAKQALEIIERGVEAVRLLQRGNSGGLRIAYCNGFHCSFISEPLAVLQQESSVQISLCDMSPAEQLKEIGAGHIDIGVIGLEPPADRLADLKDLAWECVAKHRAMVALAITHPLARKMRIELQDLADQFFGVLSEKDHPGFRGWLNTLCGGANFRPKIIQEIDEEEGLMELAATGLAVALVRGISPRVRVPGLALRPLAPATAMDCCIAWSRKNDSKPLHQLLQTLRGNAQSL